MSSRASTPADNDTASKGSFVWMHFTKLKDEGVNRCNVIMKNGKACGAKLKIDLTGSTKAMSSHLKSKHHLDKKSHIPDQSTILGHFKKAKVEHVQTLTVESLKTAIAYFIADCDLPYAIVDRKSFRDLFTLVNPQTEGMLVKRHAIAQHCRKVYDYYEQYVQKAFLSTTPYVAFTQDAWTSPNNRAFLSITGHFITDDWKLMDVVLGMPEIQGKFLSIVSSMVFLT